MPPWSAVLFCLGWLVRLVMLPVVVRRKAQPAVCLAWLTIIFLVPFVGLAAYLLIGEIRLGARHIRRHAREVDVVDKADRPDIQLRHIVEPEIEKTQQVILHVASQLGGLPVLGGNSAELLAETDLVIDRLVQDIDQAEHHLHLLFYIFAADQVGERVVATLGRARSRGVRCRLLADAAGSRKFLRVLSPKLTGQGIEVVPDLPVNPVRRLFARLDLRNHRKLVVIDGRVAYTGSQNIVRADYGTKGVGEWRDLMVRLVGPSVSQLQSVFLEDWEFETGRFIDDPSTSLHRGSTGRWPSRSSPAGRTTRRVSCGTWPWRPCMPPVAAWPSSRPTSFLMKPSWSPSGWRSHAASGWT